MGAGAFSCGSKKGAAEPEPDASGSTDACPDASWKIDAPPAGGVLLAGHPGSGNVVAVLAFGMKHIGEEKFKFQLCDIMKGEQNSPDFLAMNPFHQVPSCKMEDGTNVFESSSTLRYLAQKFAPETYPEAQALLIDMAMDKRQQDLYKAWAPLAYYAMGLKPKPAEGDAKKLTEALNKMEKAFLSGTKFVGGDTMSIADYSIFPLITTLTLPTLVKVGYTQLPDRWTTYLNDVKTELGDFYLKATEAHVGWLGSREGAVETVAFEAYEAPPALEGTWKPEAAPDGGVALYGHPVSGNVISIMSFGMKNLGDKYKFQMIDIMAGEQKSPDFVAINPFGQVPAMKASDGVCMFETCSALRALAKQYAPDTYPADKALLIDMAMDKRQQDLYGAWSPIGYYAMGLGARPAKDAAKKLNEVLALMSTVFMTGKFVGGDTMTIADYAIFPLVNTLLHPTIKKVGYEPPPSVATYIAGVKAELGDVFTESVKAHEEYLDSVLEKTEAVEFDE